MSTAEEVLERRARRLARPASAVDERSTRPALVLELGEGARYVLDATRVREVAANARLRRLPANSQWFLGMMPSRGEVVPVVDLARLLGAEPASGQPYAVVLEHPTDPVALLVDDVLEVVALPVELLTTGENRAVGSSLTPDGVTVLDAELLLAQVRAPAGGAAAL